MPVLTDPRQIVSPLPACLMKEVLDGLTSVSSAPERIEAAENKPNAETSNMGAEDGARTGPGISACPAKEKPRRDTFYREKRLVECWSLSTSKEFHGELPVQSQATKELILQEAILWHAREQESEKWKAFQP